MSTKELKDGAETIKVKSRIADSILTAEIGQDRIELEILPLKNGEAILRRNGKSYSVIVKRDKSKYWVSLNGRIYTFEDARSEEDFGLGSQAENSIAAPMPGKVIKVIVNEGEEVEEGQVVIIVEAMKMEHSLRAPANGRIAKVLCKEGDQVDANVPLVEFESE